MGITKFFIPMYNVFLSNLLHGDMEAGVHPELSVEGVDDVAGACIWPDNQGCQLWHLRQSIRFLTYQNRQYLQLAVKVSQICFVITC